VDAVALARLDKLCDEANRVVGLGEIHDGDRDSYTIGMRHDCDDHAYESILPLAEWEHRRGRRSTFYLLHTAPWYDRALEDCLPTKLQALGHEVGLHLNWVPAHERYGVSGHDVLAYELSKLRVSAPGVEIRSVVGHGDDACYRTKLVNYSMFVEAGNMRPPWKQYEEATTYKQRSVADYDLDFLGEFVHKGAYLSDSGDTWIPCISDAVDHFPYEGGPLVILQHPDWYAPRLFV